MKTVRSTDYPLVPASHEDPQNPGVLKRVLLAASDLPRGRIMMFNTAVLGPTKSFAPHYHEDMTEVFFICSGEAEMTVGNSRVSLRPGDLIVVEEREVHQLRNYSTDTTCEYIVFGVSREAGGKTVNV